MRDGTEGKGVWKSGKGRGRATPKGRQYEDAALAEVRALRAEGLPAVVSGAGPSVLVLASDPTERLRAAELIGTVSASPWNVLLPAVDFKGATVTVHPVEALA